MNALHSIFQTTWTAYVWEFSINLLGPKGCTWKAGKSSREKHQGKVSTRNRAERKIQMKKYIQSIQYYTHKGCYMPGARSPVSAKIQVIHAAVTGSPEHGHCDTASFFHRTSQIILPWSPSKPEFFCLSPTACPCSASFCAAASTIEFLVLLDLVFLEFWTSAYHPDIPCPINSLSFFPFSHMLSPSLSLTVSPRPSSSFSGINLLFPAGFQ